MAPDGVALEFDGETLSYRELWSRASRLAAELRARGARPDVPVAICAERSVEMVVGLLGILAAGAPYLPLDPQQPPARSARMAAIAGAATVLVQRRFSATVADFTSSPIVLDAAEAPWSRHVPGDAGLSAAELPGAPGDLAYVIFTSGSTGEPKGVMNTHAGIVNRLRWMQSAHAIGPADRILQKTPFGFDVSVWEFFWPLITGARLVVALPGVHRDPRAVADLVKSAGITVIHFVPSMLDAFLELHDLEETCVSLRHVVTSGEALSEAAARATVQRMPARLHNLYGPTEAAVEATFHDFLADDPPGPVPIGRPIANMRAYVLDAERRPTPVGETGELWLAGVGVARGYVGRPDLTAERFLPDPFHGGTMYRTGDLARWRPDGAIEYLGRTDHQVKIRGVRVELGEIEAAIERVVPGARAVVVAREDRPGDVCLAAYVVGAAGIDDATLRDRLAPLLPAAMVPSHVVRLAAFPVTTNGKLDRAALPEPRRDDLAMSGDPPRGPVESMVAELWQGLLGVQTVGRDDDFFDLGGNSLSAMRLVARIEAAAGVRLPVRSVFDRPRLADLAGAIALRGAAADVVPPSASTVAPEGPIDLPALPAQRGMWALQEHLPDRATYNQPFAFRVGSAIDPEAFRAALVALMARHPALRAGIVPTREGPVQRVTVAEKGEVDWAVEPGVGPESIAAALVEHARRPFDLATPPLWRVRFFPDAAPHGVILFVFHHVVVDEWSVGLFLDEIAALASGTSALPRAPACRIDPPAGARREELLRFWESELAGAPAAVRLPGSRSTEGAGTSGSILRRKLLGLAPALRDAARAGRCTVAQRLVGLFHSWLQRITVATDVVVVTPLSLRAMGVAEDAFGCCLNTVPIRLRWEVDDAGRPARGTTLPEIVGRVRRTMIEAGDHAELPFDEIVAGACRRGPRGGPLSDILVVVTEGSRKAGRFGAAVLEPLPCDTATAKFGATFFFDVAGDDVELAVEHATAVYDEALVAAHLSTLTAFLEAAIRDPGASIETLPLDGHSRDAEAAAGPAPPPPSLPPIHAAAIGFARTAPGLPAVIAGAGTVSYAELDLRSRALAARLTELGSRPEERVGVCLPRGASSCVALLGVLRAGAVCVPLDPSLPLERLGRMVAIAGVRFVVHADSTAPVVAALGDVRGVPAEGHPPAPGFVDPPVPAEALAYVLFTSGSTGDPKGVEMPHGPLAALFDWQTRSTPRSPGDRTLHFASTGFDVAFQEVFSSWAAGCTVVVADEEVRRDPSRLVDLLSRERIDRAILPTAMLIPMAEAVLASGAAPTGLRDVIVAGERLQITDSVRRLFSVLSGCRLWNHYGPTETHVVTAHLLEGPPAAWPDHPPIGLPIDGAEVWVVGPDGGRLPPGCVGEIVLGGGCLARGYASRPDLTEERFLVEQGPVSVCRTYRTGDLGWIRPDGAIECLGRNDGQVKISGHRIEPGEVEAALSACPGVRRAAVIVRRDGPVGAPRLVAFLEVESGWPGANATRARLRTTLSEPMIPSVVVPVELFPTNVNGKIDRRTLETLPIRPDADTTSLDDGDPPRGPVETAVAEEWARILGVPSVSREDDFFALGGHSLPAMMLVAAIDRRLGVRIPVRTVFDRPRLADLAAAIGGLPAASGHDAAAPAAEAVCSAEAESVPALPAQRGMWLLHEILPDPAAYNQPMAFRPSAAVDWDAFRERLASAMDRHPSLRASLRAEEGVLVQRHAAPGSLPVLWSVEPDVGPEEVDAALREWARVPFDLARGPLWRAILFPEGGPHGVLLLLFHHAVVDDWSIRTLLAELSGGKEAAPPSSALPLPPPPPADGDREYWTRLLDGAPSALVWPGRKAPSPTPSGRGEVVRFAIAPHVVQAWQRIARASGGTLFHAWLGACHVWLQRVCDCRDSVVLTPVATRTDDGVQSTVGCHLNTLPTRFERSAGPQTAAAVTAAVRASFLDALDHGGLPFDGIVAAVAGSSGRGMQPLANAMFVLLEDPRACWRFGDVPVEPVAVHTGTARFDLTLAIRHAGADGGAMAEVEYSLDVLDEVAVRAMARRLASLLDAVAADPSVDLESLDLLGERERSQVLGDFAGESFDAGPPTTLHGLVDGVLSIAGDAPVLRDATRVWTRGELDRRARGLARALRERGAGPGTRVGVTVPRSMEYVAVVLGVLRTGAAWVPVDVSSAPARAEFIVADADLVAVVADGPAGIRLPDDVAVVDLAAGWPDAGTAGWGRAPAVDPSAPAYVMFTSGSTGKPKGVVVPHSAAVAFVRAMQRRHPLSKNDTFLFATGTTFDISVYEVFGALAAGATIVAAPAGIPDPAVIARLAVDAGVTVAQFVPSFLDLLVEEPAFGANRTLRRVFCGGEALPASLVSRFHRCCGAELVNGYGPTEVTVYATSWTCPRGADAVTPPIGRPLGNVRARLLDDALRPAAVGVAAELFLGGVQVAVGYLGRPDLDRERFVPDPYGAVGDRLYRTGDLCRWQEDGTIEFLGRLDHQVKVRGHRIELGEVEAEIERLVPGARAIVSARQDSAGDVRLVAYVVGISGWDDTVLRAGLAATLTEASIPARFVHLDAFPVLPNGKIDRAALPAPGLAATAPAPSDPPRGATEEAIAVIWSHLLGGRGVNRDDRFFDVGGNSLLAMRMVAATERTLGVRVPLRGVFVAPRLADFAAVVDQLRGDGDDAGGRMDLSLLGTHERLVPLQPLGERPPLIMIHGFGGGVSHFLPVAARLAPDVPVFGLMDRNLADDSSEVEAMAELAERYADEIERFVDGRPIRLCSHSHGGWIAFEVARVLRSRSRSLGAVILLDTHPGAVLPAMGKVCVAPWLIADRLWRQVQWFNALREGHVPRSVRRFVGKLRGRPAEAPDWYRDGADLRGFRELIASHQTDRYDGRVDFVHANNARCTVIPHWKWLVGTGLRVHPVPIAHHELCDEKHADSIGRLLRGILDEVEACVRDGAGGGGAGARRR